MSNILIVGRLDDDKWIGSLVRNVKAYDQSLSIDFYNTQYDYDSSNKTIQLLGNIGSKTRHYPNFVYRIPKLRSFFIRKDATQSFDEWIERCKERGIHYDVINFQYIKCETICLWSKLKDISDKLVLTPWGSDILRVSKSTLNKMRDYASHFDVITTTENERFNDQIKESIGNDNIQYLHLDLGSEVIDHLTNRLDINKEESKLRLGLDEKYVIEIGYNGYSAQNHLLVIDAIQAVRSSLPNNLCVVLPLTYGLSDSYKEQIISRLQQYNIEYKLYTNYLSVDEIFYLRRCADMFIHAQQTDANSASIAEYMICGTTIVNATWLNYSNREIYGKPYYEFSDFRELPEVIVNAYNNGSLVSEELVSDMKKLGWKYWASKWIELYKGNHHE